MTIERKYFWASESTTSVKEGELEDVVSESQVNSSISRREKLQSCS